MGVLDRLGIVAGVVDEGTTVESESASSSSLGIESNGALEDALFQWTSRVMVDERTAEP